MDFDKETMRSLMIDHIDGKITGELAKYVEVHLEKNPEAKKEYDELKEVIELMGSDQPIEVPAHIKNDFLQEAEQEFSKKPDIKTRTITATLPWRVAAAVAFVVAAYFGGSWILNRAEIKNLQSNLESTKEQLLLSMVKQESASERLKGVFMSQEFESVNDDIVAALEFTLNNDNNINVRIAAAEALSKFESNEKARTSLIASLNQQEYPAVQLKLIDILVSIGDKNAIDPIQEFSQKEELIKSVKDEAHMGIFKLM